MHHEPSTSTTDRSPLTPKQQSCVRAAARTWASDQEWVVPNTTPPCVLRVETTDVTLVPDGDKVGDIQQLVARDAAGKFYTSERTGTVAVWSPTGTLERTFGRAGQGPGEFTRGPLNIVPAPSDQLYVLDNGGRWHLFRTNGTFVQTVQSSGTRSVGHFAVLDDGRLLDATGRDDPGHFFTIWSPLGDAKNPRPVITQRIAAISETDRKTSRTDRERDLAYSAGSGFWAGPPQAIGRGYQLEQWSTNGTRLKSIRRNVPWFPNGADRAQPRAAVPSPPPHEIESVWNLGDDLLLVVALAPLPGDWSQARNRMPDGATLDKLMDIWVEVIDTRSGRLLAQLGPLKYAVASRMLPVNMFNGSLMGYRFDTTDDDERIVRVLRLRLEAK